MLTGWPTHVRGHRSQQYFLRPQEPNLFRYLRDAGYDVYWFGKNDALAAQSFDASVTEWNSVDGKPIRRATPVVGGRRTGMCPAGPLTFLDANATPGDRRNTGDYFCVKAALEILGRRESDRPFCIFLALGSPHPPYNSPAGFATMYRPAEIHGLIPRKLEGRPDYIAKIQRAYGLDSVGDDTLRAVRAAYYGKVSFTDWLLGELLEGMERSNRFRDTALLATSDHGDYAGDYGLVEKWPSGLEECLTHVPLLAKLPGAPQGRTSSYMVQVYDVMQTCLDIAGIQAKHTHFSRSLLPMLNGSKGDPERPAVFEGGYNVYEPQCFEPEPPRGAEYYPRLHLHHQSPQSVSRVAGIKTKEYRFVSRPQGISELYLLRQDPREFHNVYGTLSAASVQAEAERRLLEWYVNTSGVAPWDFDQRGFPPFIPMPSFPPRPGGADIVADTL